MESNNAIFGAKTSSIRVRHQATGQTKLPDPPQTTYVKKQQIMFKIMTRNV